VLGLTALQNRDSWILFMRALFKTSYTVAQSNLDPHIPLKPLAAKGDMQRYNHKVDVN